MSDNDIYCIYKIYDKIYKMVNKRRNNKMMVMVRALKSKIDEQTLYEMIVGSRR